MSEPSTVSCSDVQSWLAEYVDGELASRQATMVTSHLAACGECNELFVYERELVHDLRRRVQQVEMPLAVRERLWAMLDDAAEQATRGSTDA